MLEVRGLNTNYGEFHVLHDISLNVADEDIVVVFGPNGHGKSTLLKTICGLHRATTGSIIFDGKNVTNMHATDLVHMGLIYIAEDRHLFPQMTVLENLELGSFYIKRAMPKRKENLDYVFELFPRLKERINKKASTLSGGEARMLAIGRGLMSNGKLLAIDEPSLGLAPNLREEVFKKIKQINETGITILLVEQDITEASDYTKDIYLVEDGKVVFHGNKEEVMGNKHVKEAFLGI